MREQQVRQRLRKQGYRLRKRDNCYMIVESDHNFAIAGGEGNGYSLSFEDVVKFCDE